jgi:hypothetical protein
VTTKAHVKDEWERDMVGIAVVRDHGGQREILQWETVAVATRSAEDGYRVEDERDRLHIREDDARAIYEALAEHFGHNGHDVRALRKDYDAERSRVDRLIAHLTGGAR